jgi:hypothetical protein
MRGQSLSEQLWSGLGNAISDVREKLETSLWGSPVTERGESPQWPQAQEQELGSHAHSIERERSTPDLDLDR